ncbi:TPA: oligosaccharide repeat unit polymerase [Klebsiella quasipneumoniae]|nr:oligosaccharide repeat unit polymerase [Klebsiella quasipneumoniae]
MKIINNLYFVVLFSFVISFALFLLKLSGIYPDTSFGFFLFFLSFLLALFIFGLFMSGSFRKWFALARVSVERKSEVYSFKYWPIITILIFLVIEIIYNRKIPILEMLRGNQYDYRDFTFPGLHVFFTSLTTFYCIKSFFNYIAFKEKKALYVSIICILIFATLMYRSNIMFCILNMVFLFILFKRVNIKRIFKVVFFVLCLMYVFGVAGDLRSKAQTGDSDFSITNIMNATQASSSFENNSFLSPFYWAYLYISSPVANFQKTVNVYTTHNETDGISKFAIYEILPDIIGKRVAALAGYDEDYSPLARVIDFLTVGTIFADSFVFVGWFGPIILMMLFIITPIAFLSACPKNYIFFVQFSICTILLILCTFSNMLVYSTLSLQLFYPLLYRKFRFS